MFDDYTIRQATVDDAPIIVHHRRAMFTDMGLADPNDPAGLDAMEATFAPYVTRALGDGSYRGWLAETDGGRVVAGGGLIVHEWPARPGNPSDPRRAYILNVYTEPEYRKRGIGPAHRDDHPRLVPRGRVLGGVAARQRLRTAAV